MTNTAHALDPASLPEWNLDDLYSGPDDVLIGEDLAWAESASKAFAETYQGKLASSSGEVLGQAIEAYEEIIEKIHGVMSYAQLLFAADMSDGEVARFQQNVQERVTGISSDTLFFTLEINRIEDERLEELLAESPRAAKYRPWLRDTRVYRNHQLSDDLEKLLHEKSVAGRNAWVRLFEETMAGLRFPIDGEDKTLSDTLNMLSDTNPAERKKGAEGLGQVLGDNIKLFALITNTLAKDKEIEDSWRGYASPLSSRNLANQVEDEVVHALAEAVTSNYANLSHRYYALKAKWFGVEKLDYWDRNAPLPDDADKLYSWEEAKSTVLDAYGRFTPNMADIAQDFFDKRWIDAPPREGKDSGAFSHPTVPAAHPYILMNFHGKSRDVMTLAHELGHGVHQVLSNAQGPLMCDTPLTLAETASVFGEMLTFQSMLAAETDPKRRRILLAGKVEDMMNTVVRQIAFHQFETQVHGRRKDGELSVDELGDIWMQVQTESLGPVFRFDDTYRHYWAYIPHFLHAPFYVYAYAFGDCLVNSLYDVFDGGHEGFQAKYLEMLKAGGTLRHKELLAPFGLDAGDPAFWNRGLNVVSRFIDELEAE